MPKTTKPPKLTPEELDRLDITIAWANFILYCRQVIPHGTVKVEITQGEPRRLLKGEREIRFDKPGTLPPWPETQGLDLLDST